MVSFTGSRQSPQQYNAGAEDDYSQDGISQQQRNGEWIGSTNLYSEFCGIELGVSASLFRTNAYIKFAPAMEGTTTADGIRNYNWKDDKTFLLLNARDAVRLIYELQQIDSVEDERRFSPTRGIYPKRELEIFPASKIPGLEFPEPTSAVYLIQYDTPHEHQAGEASKEILFLAPWEGDEDNMYSPDLKVIEQFMQSYLDSICRLDFASVQSMGRGRGGRAGSQASSVSSPPRRPGAARPAGGGAPYRYRQAPGTGHSAPPLPTQEDTTSQEAQQKDAGEFDDDL